MKKIELQKILRESGIGTKEAAKALFPGNAFPVQALARTIGQDVPLDENQIRALSELTGLSIPELFTEDGWKSRNSEGIFTFEKNGYHAELNMQTMITRLTKDGNRVHEELICSKGILLSEYLEKLETLINR